MVRVRYLETHRQIDTQTGDGVQIVTTGSAAVSLYGHPTNRITQRGVFIITGATSLNGATCFLFFWPCTKRLVVIFQIHEDQVGCQASCSRMPIGRGWTLGFQHRDLGLRDRHPSSPGFMSPNCFLETALFTKKKLAMKILEISSLSAPSPVAVTGTHKLLCL